MLVLAPALKVMGLPELLALYLGAFLGVLPVQLGILYYLGWKRNGRLSLESIVLLRSRVPAGRMLIMVLSLFLWAALVFALLGSLLDGALLPAFRWMPALLTTVTEDFSGLPRSLALIVWGVGFVGSALLAPLVEELYFRGFLMPRIPLSSAGAALANAVLFSLYHFWSPWKALTRIVEVAPMNYAVQKSQSIWVSVATHCLLNSVSMIGALVISLN